ncbi:MAG TPA: RNB domain-containing ribonuclease [Pirellula sp.]|nr:RNB domain-containing ribonuclease [Pirellula sp.]
MNIAEQAQKSLSTGFASIVEQFHLPLHFPPEVVAAADNATKNEGFERPPWMSQRRDATDIPFVTLDPASSTDLDQAFAIEQDGADLVLSYALADVSAFVPVSSPVENEAWQRGVTIYGLAQKIPLYPKVISQWAASLLPVGPRPAVLVVVSIRPDGRISFRSIERVVCVSRAKLAYDRVDLSSIPFVEEFARRMWADETARGATRVEFPQQEVIGDETAPCGVRLVLRARVLSESINSTLSLAVNMAIGTLFRDARVGLFRVMDEPQSRVIEILRRAAHALGIAWDSSESLRDLQRRLDPMNISHQRFLLDARRAGGRARYAVFNGEKPPWHSAIGATYAHVTAPMRRLADRYALDLANFIANGISVPQSLNDQLLALPAVMGRYEDRATNVERAVIDLLEAVSLQNRVGEILDAEVVDAENSIVQTHDSAIRSKATKLPKLDNGAMVRVRIEVADPSTRNVRLTALP